MWSGGHLVWWREWGAVCTCTEDGGKFPTLKPHLEVNNYPRTGTDMLQTTLLVHCSQGAPQLPLYTWTRGAWMMAILNIHTQLGNQTTALAIKGQLSGEGPGDCTGNQGPALWWRPRGLHWLSRASTLVKVQGTALELRASTPLRVQGTELAVIPH